MRLSAKSIFSLNLFVFLIGLCLFKQNHTSALGCSRQLIAFKARHCTLAAFASVLYQTHLFGDEICHKLKKRHTKLLLDWVARDIAGICIMLLES